VGGSQSILLAESFSGPPEFHSFTFKMEGLPQSSYLRSPVFWGMERRQWLSNSLYGHGPKMGVSTGLPDWLVVLVRAAQELAPVVRDIKDFGGVLLTCLHGGEKNTSVHRFLYERCFVGNENPGLY